MQYIAVFYANLNYAYLVPERYKFVIRSSYELLLDTMRERGGYIPHCDHAVPEEVSLKNYLHYRRRCLELGG